LLGPCSGLHGIIQLHGRLHGRDCMACMHAWCAAGIITASLQ
jgi:hypothetical protein